jgi:hypothetical protein
MAMKRSFLLLGILAATAAATPALAGALNQNLVPAGARWLLHLDAEAFRQSRIGAMITEEKFESQVRKAEADAKTDFSFSFTKVTAVTAFGARIGDGSDKDGVLMIQTPADVRSDMAKLIAIKEAGTTGEPPISKIAHGDATTYSIGHDLFLMDGGPNVWLLGKSKTALEGARQVAIGKAAALTDAEFLKFPAPENTFFFMAAADTGSTGAKLPAQARILQNADGGRIVIGELGDKLFLNLALKSKDTGTIQKIRDVLYGLKALAALTASEDKDLAALTSSAAVSATDHVVSVNLSFPVKRAMERAREDK